MKANRKVMLGAALVVAIVALAGVGYAAATGYKATMQVIDNSVGPSEYIFIKEADNKYTKAFAGTYAFDTETTWNTDVDPDAAYVKYSNCQKISDDGQTPVLTDKKFTYNDTDEVFEVATSGGDYDGYLVGTLTVVFDKATSTASKFYLVVETSTLTELVKPNNVSIVFTKTVGGTETVVDLADLDPIELTASGNVVFSAYLAVADAGVPLADAQAGTSASLSGIALDFTVYAGAVPSPSP